jgi:hypothetical protein
MTIGLLALHAVHTARGDIATAGFLWALPTR